MNQSKKDGASSAEIEEGRLRLEEKTFPFDTYPTQRGPARVPRVGECADKHFVWPLFIREKNRMRPSGSVRGAPGDRCPYRDHQLTPPCAHSYTFDAYSMSAIVRQLGTSTGGCPVFLHHRSMDLIQSSIAEKNRSSVGFSHSIGFKVEPQCRNEIGQVFLRLYIPNLLMQVHTSYVAAAAKCDIS